MWGSCFSAFGAIFAGLWLLHLPWLRLPYFWDEAGYFIPAARDLLLTGDLIPHTTLSNAHPPVVMIYLAAVWKLTAYTPMVTRTAMLAVAAWGFTALWLMARRAVGEAASVADVLLAALSPVMFSQSMMAHLDIAAFALLMWTLYAYLYGRRWQAILFAALAGVAKETALAVPFTLALIDLAALGARWWCEVGVGKSNAHGAGIALSHPIGAKESAARVGHPVPLGLTSLGLPQRALAECASWLLVPLPLAAWLGYHLHRTGHVFGNPDYLRYNVGATVTPTRIALSFLMRLWHTAGYMNLFVLTASALALLWMARGESGGDQRESGLTPDVPHLPKTADVGHRRIEPFVRFVLLAVILVQVAEFSVVGGALLARYMIAAIPLVILLAVDVVRRHAPGWRWWIAGCSVAFIAASYFNPPTFISPEDNLTWTRFVEMQQEAAKYVEQHYASQRILTAWPASDELNRPFLGYVAQPLTVVRVENFSAEEILKAAAQPESFDVVVAFSSKYEPPSGYYRRIPGLGKMMTRYFDYHQDLPAATIARLLHGRIAWQANSTGEWIAVIEIDRIRLAQAGK